MISERHQDHRYHASAPCAERRKDCADALREYYSFQFGEHQKAKYGTLLSKFKFPNWWLLIAAATTPSVSLSQW